jgi:hypothetical protein
MESAPASNVFALPARLCGQRLHGYVREHLLKFEQALFAGLPYTIITDAVRAAGFAETSVHTVEQAVYRARRYKRPKFAMNPDPRPVSEPPVGPTPRWAGTPRASTKEDMAAIGRRLRELARPPRPGERDPLN